MIDTVNFAVSTRRARSLYWMVKQYFESEQSNVKAQKNPYLKIGVFDSADKELTMARGFIRLPSSDYKINMVYYKSKEEIEFNMSIPKYYYGTNVLQYIVTNRYVEYNAGAVSINWQRENAYRMMIQFFKDFIKEILLDKVTLAEIRIKRIDFCFNLVFNEVKHLEIYYEHLKQVRMKYLRETSNKLSSYETSFSYVGKGYSFKIYKKGAEFRKNDKSKLVKANEIKMRKFNVSALEDLANRSLRFEMTLHNGVMSRVFREAWFRKDDQRWKVLKQVYNAKQNKTLNGWEALKLLRAHGMDEIDIKVYKKALSKKVDFYLSVPEYVSSSNRYYTGEVLTTALMSGNFFDFLLLKFWDKVQDFKLTNIETFSEKLVKLEEGDEKKEFEERKQRRLNMLRKHKAFYESKIKLNEEKIKVLKEKGKETNLYEARIEKYRHEVEKKGSDLLRVLDEKMIAKSNKFLWRKLMKWFKNYTLDELKEYEFISERSYYNYKKMIKQNGGSVNFMTYTLNVQWDYERYLLDVINNGLLTKR